MRWILTTHFTHLFDFRALVAQTNGNKKALKLIMQLANQSLGIILYEKLVANYVEMNLVVKQSWYVSLILFIPNIYH